MRLKNKNLHYLAAGLAYFALAVAATWPLALHLTKGYPTPDPWTGGDPNVYIWLIDWLAKALAGATSVPPSLMLFWPQGIDAWGGYDGALMLAVGLPVRWLTGNPILAYNLIILLSFAASALAAYALVRWLTGSTYAAAIGGFIFGFSPYMMIRATQHANLIMTFTVPLLALAAIAFCRRPTRRGAWWLAGAVLLNALSSFYYDVGGLIFLAVLFFFYRRELLADRHVRLTLPAAGAVVLAAVLPALPMLLSPSGGGQPSPFEFVSAFGASVYNFVYPHPLMNLTKLLTDWWPSFQPVFLNGTSYFEPTSYLGPILIALVAAALVERRRIGAADWKFWTLCLLGFLVLAIGVDMNIEGLRIPMPFALLRFVFPLSLVRVPNRFFVFALLAATVLAGYALRQIRRNTPGRIALAGFTAVVVGLLAFERLIYPYPILDKPVPEFYKQLAADKQLYAVADLPVSNPGFSDYDFFQTYHGKPIVDGEYFYPSYRPRTFAFLKANPLMAAAVCRQNAPADPPPIDREETYQQFRSIGVRYIVVHNLTLQNADQCSSPRKAIRAFFEGQKPVFTDGEITAYEVPDWDRPPAS